MQQTASQPCVERITHRVLRPPSPTSAQSLFVCLSSGPVGREKVQNMNPSTSWLPFLSYHRGHRWCCFKGSAFIVYIILDAIPLKVTLIPPCWPPDTCSFPDKISTRSSQSSCSSEQNLNLLSHHCLYMAK